MEKCNKTTIMSWLEKTALTEVGRIQRNISRLEELKSKVHDLGNFVVSSNSGGYSYLKQLVDDKLVLGRQKVHDKLKEALIGENNQKIALDAPTRFQSIMVEAEALINNEIVKEQRDLKELGG
jgi:hypothetical protein